MKGWSLIALIVLLLTSINALLLFIYITGSVFGLAYTNNLNKLGFDLILPIIGVAGDLFIAASLYHLKEGIWRAIAFIALALLTVVDTIVFRMPNTDLHTVSLIGYFGTLTLIYFFIQSFLIKNKWLTTSLRLFSSFFILQSLINIGMPLVAVKMAMPSYEMLRYLSFFSLLVIATKIYLLAVIYNHFNNQNYQDQLYFKERL